MIRRTIEVISCYGDVFPVDISDEACKVYNVKTGERFISKKYGKGTIIGVGPDIGINKEKTVLWVRLDSDGDKVSYFKNPKTELKKI